MAEYKCGKTNKCILANNCPHNLYPEISYRCFESKNKWADKAYDKVKKNKKLEEKEKKK